MDKLKALISFESLVDLNYGIIKVVKEKYNNAKYINSELLDSIDDNLIYDILTNHPNKNIFTLFLNKDYKDSAEKLQKEILESDYESIVTNSCVTNILQLAKTYIDTNDIIVYILCKNKIEEQFIKKYLKGSVIITANDIDMIDTSPYDVFFIKDAENMKLLGDISGKKVYVSNYKFNLETNKDKTINIKNSILSKVSYPCDIVIIDSFNIPDKYKIKG